MRRVILFLLMLIGYSAKSQTLVATTVSIAGKYAFISGLPNGQRWYSGNWKDSLNVYPLQSSISTVGFSGQYNDLISKPTLFDGDYNSLTNKPTIPTNNNQLTNGSGYITKSQGDTYYKAISYVPGWSEITGKPSFFSGDYNDLTNKPTIPTNTNQLTNGAGFITKTDGDGYYKPIGYNPAWTDVTGKPTFATVSTSGSYNDLSNKPTIPATQVNSDWNANSGLAQILNKPSIKRIETYTGTTNASGIYTVTYANAFSSKPKVLVSYEGANNKNNVFVSASSTTGFTITATQYNAISALGFEVLAGAPTALTSATVNVIVIE